MIFKEQDKRDGKTIRFRGIRNVYITINQDDQENKRELFISCTASGTTVRGLCEALGRVISIAIQHDSRLVQKIAKTLSGILSEQSFINDKYGKAESIPDAISKVLDDAAL